MRRRPISPSLSRRAVVSEIVGGADHLTGFLEQHFAVRGEAHRTARSDEQPHAERAFELLDAFGERRLGDVQPRRGAGEMQFVGESGKRGQGVERRSGLSFQ